MNRCSGCQQTGEGEKRIAFARTVIVFRGGGGLVVLRVRVLCVFIKLLLITTQSDSSVGGCARARNIEQHFMSAVFFDQQQERELQGGPGETATLTILALIPPFRKIENLAQCVWIKKTLIWITRKWPWRLEFL